MDVKTDEEKAEEKRGFDLNGFNQYRSDRIPLDRSVPDNRHSKLVSVSECDKYIYVCVSTIETVTRQEV